MPDTQICAMEGETLNKLKIEFLYKAIDDAQQTIRFTDTKTGVTTFLLGIFIAMIGSGLPDFAKYFWNMKCFQQVIYFQIILLFSIFTLMTIYKAIQVVFPKSNPAEHVKKTYKPLDIFYLWDLAKEYNKDVIRPSLEDYMSKMEKVDSESALIKELSYELLKVSYIRESKIKNVRSMKRWLIASLSVIPILIFLHYWGLSHYMPATKC